MTDDEGTAMSEQDESQIVAEWQMWAEPICPYVEPELCDCGFKGAWERRWVYVWHDVPGHKRHDRSVRRDIAKGRPPRPNDEGWWIVDGWDERCPGCGDIERFNFEAERVTRFAEQAKVLIFMDARRKVAR